MVRKEIRGNCEFMFDYQELENMTDFSACKTNKDVYNILSDCIHDINIAYWFGYVKPEIIKIGVDDLIELLHRLIGLALNDYISTCELQDICTNRLNEYVRQKLEANS